MTKLMKISFLMILFPIILSAMQEPFEDEIEKEDNIISSKEKILNDLEKIHEQVNEFWKKQSPGQRKDLTKSV